MAAKRKEFTDRQKADIFVRDRALCCFSGISLWLLDYGASPAQVNWADHSDPASKGGAADIDNGACASWIYNKYRSNSGQGIYLFLEGRPTQDFFVLHEVVPVEVAAHLERFSRLHFSDWFLDRAIFHTKLGAYHEEGTQRPDGKPYSRGIDYRSKAALNCVNEWRKHVKQTKPMALESRGLIPDNPSADQIALLELRNAKTLSEIGTLIAAISPYCKSSFDAVKQLAHVSSAREAHALLRRVQQDEYVTERVKRSVALNVERLWG